MVRSRQTLSPIQSVLFLYTTRKKEKEEKKYAPNLINVHLRSQQTDLSGKALVCV